MEEIQIILRRPKPRERRVTGQCVLLVSGGVHDLSSPNMPTALKKLDGIMRKHGFGGIYPKDKAELELFKSMYTNPKKHLKGQAFQPAREVPSEKELDRLSHTGLQEMCHRFDIKATGDKRTLIKRLRAHMVRDLGYIAPTTKGKKKDGEEIEKIPVPPIPSVEELAEKPRKELQELCEIHGKDIAGSQVELIARLLKKPVEAVYAILNRAMPPEPKPEPEAEPAGEYDAFPRKRLQNICRKRKLSVEGSREELIERLQGYKEALVEKVESMTETELMNLGRKDLQDICKSLKIDFAGDKPILINRIADKIDVTKDVPDERRKEIYDSLIEDGHSVVDAKRYANPLGSEEAEPEEEEEKEDVEEEEEQETAEEEEPEEVKEEESVPPQDEEVDDGKTPPDEEWEQAQDKEATADPKPGAEAEEEKEEKAVAEAPMDVMLQEPHKYADILRPKLKEMPYREVQKLAKSIGAYAGGSKSEIIESIVAPPETANNGGEPFEDQEDFDDALMPMGGDGMPGKGQGPVELPGPKGPPPDKHKAERARLKAKMKASGASEEEIEKALSDENDYEMNDHTTTKKKS